MSHVQAIVLASDVVVLFSAFLHHSLLGFLICNSNNTCILENGLELAEYRMKSLVPLKISISAFSFHLLC